MTLIKSISGIRGTIGGSTGDTLNTLDIVKFTTAYAQFIGGQKNKQGLSGKKPLIVVGRDGRISGLMVRNVVVGTLMGMGYDVSISVMLPPQLPSWLFACQVLMVVSSSPPLTIPVSGMP